MRIGVPRETKEGEKRAALGPGHVARLVAEGHDVRMKRGAGRGIDARGASAIAFERVRDERGRYLLLAPMSVIAGRMAFEAAVRHLGRALRASPTLRGAAVLWRGAVSHRGIAEGARLPYTPLFAAAPQ